VVVEASHEGQVGLGWTYGPGAAATVVSELLAPVVRAVDPDDVPAAWLAMQQRLRNAGRPGVGSLALSAADCAIWDLKARRHGLPLARLLGTVRRHVPVYASGGFTTYDAERQHRQLAGWVHEEGSDALTTLDSSVKSLRGTARHHQPCLSTRSTVQSMSRVVRHHGYLSLLISSG
jgi:L-alanine-DL-glutamate epimerase-like enolase superfamily enzyme